MLAIGLAGLKWLGTAEYEPVERPPGGARGLENPNQPESVRLRHSVDRRSGFIDPVTAPVPEASTWAMMLAGFAGLRYAGWRKVRQAAVRAGV